MKEASTLPRPTLREDQRLLRDKGLPGIKEFSKPAKGPGNISKYDLHKEFDTSFPLVSVIIPAYNAAHYISEALDSVINQDYPRKEIIIVDDGSTDETQKTLEPYGDHIRILTQANAGAAAARNKGLESANGDYIAFLDADDIWLPGKLTAQVTYMERNPHILMSYGKWEEWWMNNTNYIMDDKKNPEKNGENNFPLIPQYSGWLYTQLLSDFTVWTSVVMIKRELIQRIGVFREQLKQGQDFDYWLRASRISEIHMLNQNMALYRKHEGNTTASCPSRNYAAEIIEEAINRWGIYGPDGSCADKKKVKSHLGYLWFLYGWKNKNDADFQTAFSSFIKSAFYNPFKIKIWPLIALSGLYHLREIASHSLESTGDLDLVTGETEEN